MVYGLEVVTLRPKRGIFGKGAPSNHDAGSDAHAHRKETMMRFYQNTHGFYCGVDLHARSMSLCALNPASQTQALAGAAVRPYF